jgi:uncharacterized membrane protein YdfJ with MMPL/SSD domain
VARVLHRLGLFTAGHKWVVLGAWVVLVAGMVALIHTFGSNTSNNLNLPGTDSQAASNLLESRFPPQQNGSSPIVFYTKTGKVTDAKYKQAIQESYTAVKKLPHVFSATSPFSQQGQAQISKDKHTAFIGVLLDVGSNDLTQDIAEDVLDTANPGKKAGMQVAAGGPVGTELSEPATESSEVIGLVAAMIILAFTFGTLVAMGLPIISAVFGLLVGLSLIGLLGHVANVPTVAPTLATMIGLGVGIDYALFLVSRYRVFKEGFEVHEAIARAVATSGSAIVFAGTTVVIALVTLLIAGIPLVTSLGYASAFAVITAVLAALTLLPAIFSLLGRHVESVRVPAFMRPKPKPPERGFWGAWARAVTGHPWLAIGAVLAILVPLAIPFLSLNLGQEDVGATPKSTTERQAYDLISAGFGVGYNGPLAVAVNLGTPAKASSQFISQKKQAQSLQKQLGQEQKQGNASKQQLTTQSTSLQQQQTSLEQQQAQLKTQQASLERQAAALQAEQSSLNAQQSKLQAQQVLIIGQLNELGAQAAQLVKKGAKLAKEGAAVTRKLARNQAAQKKVTIELQHAKSSARQKKLETQLLALQKKEDALQKQLNQVLQQEQALRKQSQQIVSKSSQLRAQESKLVNQTIALAGQATGAAKEAVSLVKEKEQLITEASNLQVQAANLQTQGANLNTQKVQLQGQQQTAKTQQQQAEQLQTELTQELTKAGGDERGTDPQLVNLQDALSATNGVKVVSPPNINKKGDAATFTVIATTAPAATQTADLVKTLRTYTIPQATKGTDLHAHVGGQTASYVDLASAISSKLLLVIAAVIALGFLVLMTAFRSVVIPTQAAISNVLSVVAAFGVVTACFQWGWGLGIVGLDVSGDTVPIASYVPLIMFAVLFGLSMDYQVFLMSQIEHHKAKGESDHDAIAGGLATGARVIVAAALIMISVFGSFILNGDPTVKQFGVGLSVGVALAALTVLLFAPAFLVLSGRVSWWVPQWADRLLPRLDIEGASFAPRPKAAPETPPVRAGS